MAKNKKLKKEKKKQKQAEKLQQELTKFDVIKLLKTNQLDTKPKTAQFLNKYVKNITAVISNGKVQFYPILSYSIPKIFVKFLDGHELIYQIDDKLQLKEKIYLYYNLDEIEIKQNDLIYVEKLFNAVIQFKFVLLNN